MTAAFEPLHFEISSRTTRPRPHWGRAIAAMRELIRRPDRVYLAFDINRALDPDMAERSLRLMLVHPEGRRVYAARPSLMARLTDRDALTAMPEGSFGRAYLAHINRYGLDASKLVELGRESRADDTSTDSDVRWMRERSELTHDLWHVLTGYGADHVGEATLLMFSLAQTGGRSNLLLAFGANLKVVQERGLRSILYAYTAWRRGRRAICLSALPYEDLLPLSLAEVRRAANIEDPEQAHRGGVVRADLVVSC